MSDIKTQDQKNQQLEDQKLKEIKKIIEEKNEQQIVAVKLNESEIKEIDKTFKDVKDFRQL